MFNLNKKNIEIDLSDRRTGKTTRLLQRMHTFLSKEPNNVAHLIIPNLAHKHHIESMIHDGVGITGVMYTTSVKVNTYDFILNNLPMMMSMAKSGQMIFFDEFDQCITSVPIIENSYYSGTELHSDTSKSHKQVIDKLLQYAYIVHRYKITSQF